MSRYQVKDQQRNVLTDCETLTGAVAWAKCLPEADYIFDRALIVSHRVTGELYNGRIRIPSESSPRLVLVTSCKDISVLIANPVFDV